MAAARILTCGGRPAMLKRISALISVILFMTGCALGLPIIDDVVAHSHGNHDGHDSGDGDGDGDGGPEHPNSGRGNDSEGNPDEDPGNSEGNNNGGD